jgi:hypothetical protein
MPDVKSEIKVYNERDTLLDMSPVAYEERKSARLCLLLGTISSLLALTCGLIVWNVHRHANQRVGNRASTALSQGLNVNLKDQTKSIQDTCEATLLLTRHCEKHGPNVQDEDGTQHCSYIGYERAHYLATLFQPNPRGVYPTPSHLFALTPQRRNERNNFREWETLKPLSEASQVEIEITDMANMPSTWFDMLKSGAMCGKTAIVSWKHELIPDLATLLGCGPDRGCPTSYPDDEFGLIWQLKYVFHAGEQHTVWKDTERDVQTTSKNLYHANRRLSSQQQRRLGKTTSKSHPVWEVYASVVNQHFDPLAYSYSVGDYSVDGVPSGGRWKDDEN